MAEWIELWDLEAMTSCNREIGVCGVVGTSRLEFFLAGFILTFFLHIAESVLSEVLLNSSKF